MTNATQQVTENEISRKDGAIYADLSCGKTRAFVCINHREVRVICQNASHAAFGRAGRGFQSIALALDGYKSESMKAIIRHADSLNH